MCHALGNCSLVRKQISGNGASHKGNRTHDLDETAGMGIFKPDFYRFFLVGFAAGAVFVVATMDSTAGSQLRQGVMPVADAAPSE
jgi:hypothetical protein